MQFTKPGALERGESYFITGKGSIGMAMRAKTPIFDNKGNVIGVVSIGYLVSKIDSAAGLLITDGGVFVLLLVVLMLLSVFRRAYPPTNAGHGAETDCARGTPAGGVV